MLEAIVEVGWLRFDGSDSYRGRVGCPRFETCWKSRDIAYSRNRPTNHFSQSELLFRCICFDNDYYQDVFWWLSIPTMAPSATGGAPKTGTNCKGTRAPEHGVDLGWRTPAGVDSTTMESEDQDSATTRGMFPVFRRLHGQNAWHHN